MIMYCLVLRLCLYRLASCVSRNVDDLFALYLLCICLRVIIGQQLNELFMRITFCRRNRMHGELLRRSILYLDFNELDVNPVIKMHTVSCLFSTNAQMRNE